MAPTYIVYKIGIHPRLGETHEVGQHEGQEEKKQQKPPSFQNILLSLHEASTTQVTASDTNALKIKKIETKRTSNVSPAGQATEVKARVIEKAMAREKHTQEQQVIDVLRQTGGYATLGDLYRLVDTKSWTIKTPNESIRRIVQQSGEIFKIQPGLWALEECREEVLRKFNILPKEAKSEELFTHGYYQGLIIEIGNMKQYKTYVPAQDQNRKFIEKPLKDICSTIHIPEFSFASLTDRARTVDVIWFNERNMPNSFFAENGGYPPTQNGDIRSLFWLFVSVSAMLVSMRQKKYRSSFYS